MFVFLFELFRKRFEYRQNQRMTRRQLQQLQLQKFRRLVRYAAENSPYYARIIHDRKIDVASCAPKEFPPLTKSTLMSHYDDIATDRRITKQAVADFLARSTGPNELLFDQYHVVHTSGSSGQVGYFVFSEADWGRGFAQVYRRRITRLGLRRQKLAFFGATGGHFGGVSMVSMGARGIFRWLVEIGIYEVNSPLPEVVERLNAFQPNSLFGYPTALKILAEKQMQGSLRISPTSVSTAGEPLSDSNRRLLSRAFGCGAINSYACSEHLAMGFSKPDDSNIILYDDDLIYEFHDDHTLVTNLFNFTVPLIRYRMSDILRPIEGDDSASPYITISNVVGRSELVPTFMNQDGVEDFISPFTIVELFIPGVTRFQMHLISKTHFQFRACLDATLTPEQQNESLAAARRRLREVLDQKLMKNVTFEVVPVGDLPVDPKTRKFRLIVDETAGSEFDAPLSQSVD